MKCEKCGKYSGGATLCKKCEKKSVKSKLAALLALAALSGCGKLPASLDPSKPVDGENTVTTATTTPETTVVDVIPVPTPSATPTSVVVYSLTETRYDSRLVSAPGTSGGHYTVTGVCLTFGTQVYCRDDGAKAFLWTISNFTRNIGFSFFNACTEPDGRVGVCGGAMGTPGYTDALTSFLRIDVRSGVASQLTSLIDDVYNHGTQTLVDCQESDTTLDCGTFTIDLTQAAL